jgi:hypothetical protein
MEIYKIIVALILITLLILLSIEYYFINTRPKINLKDLDQQNKINKDESLNSVLSGMFDGSAPWLGSFNIYNKELKNRIS